MGGKANKMSTNLGWLNYALVQHVTDSVKYAKLTIDYQGNTKSRVILNLD